MIVHIREGFSSSQSISRLIIPLNHQRWVENYICSYLFHKWFVLDIWHYVADRLPSQQKSTTQISTVMEASVWTFCAPSGHPPSRFPKVREHKYGLFIINMSLALWHINRLYLIQYDNYSFCCFLLLFFFSFIIHMLPPLWPESRWPFSSRYCTHLQIGQR